MTDIATVSDLLLSVGQSDEAGSKVLQSILKSIHSIAELLRHGGTSQNASAATASKDRNAFGDTQLHIDVESDKIIVDGLRETAVVHIASSEEQPYEQVLNETGSLCVSYDPLDGSSVMASNFSVGSIFGIWKTSNRRLIGASGRDITISIAAVYGPCTNVYIGISSSSKVYEISAATCIREVTNGIGGQGKLFAPANLRASVDNEGYRAMVDWYMDKRYTLRYTGAMVPDVTQLLVKGYGIFMSPVSANAKAKLRLIYEALPMACLIECAGGASWDCIHGHGSLLERVVGECEERTAVCVGSSEEVKRFKSFM